jgi:hypothetical protein
MATVPLPVRRTRGTGFRQVTGRLVICMVGGLAGSVANEGARGKTRVEYPNHHYEAMPKTV